MCNLLSNIYSSAEQKPNPYTEKTIFCTLLFIQSVLSSDSEIKNFKQLLSCGMKITILGDNDFYSQRDQVLPFLKGVTL